MSICAEHVIPGLDKAVLKMKKGETALVSIASEYGYGAQEHAGELAVVPPNSDLEYEVELVSFEKVRGQDASNRAPDSPLDGLHAACHRTCTRSQNCIVADSGQLMRTSHRESHCWWLWQRHGVVVLIPVVGFGSSRPRSHGTWTARRSWRQLGRGKRKAMHSTSQGSMSEHRASMPR